MKGKNLLAAYANESNASLAAEALKKVIVYQNLFSPQRNLT
jgi:hypothetical protein